MTCEENMEKYLSLDKNEFIPTSLTLHLLTCKKCRTEVRYLGLAEKLTSNILKEQSKEIEIEKQNNPISMTKWIIGGIVMLIFLTVFGIESKDFGTDLQIAFYITFAVSICAYCAVFIGRNLDYFIKTFNKDKSQNAI